MTKKVYIKSFGCQMNEADTEIIRAILTKEDFSLVTDELDADVVMLNTCAIRENAHRKIYGRVHEIRHERKEKGAALPKIGLLGCMATNLRKDLLENRNLKIDFIAGPDSYKRLPDLIRESFAGEKAFDLTLSEFETYSDIYPTREKGVNAWLAVMRGCNNFCTFCVVPYTRGRERSRTVDNVVEEVKRLADDGFKQITLLGQNVNSYSCDGADFADLMQAVSRVDGIKRVRFTSPHPKDFPHKFLEVMAGNPKVCKHIHLPLQSGNNRVLEMMDRTYTREEYLVLVDKIRAMIPTIVLTTDIIAGFPTETEDEYKETAKVLRDVEFDSAFIFKYSERKGTIASRKYPDDVPDAIKTERVVELNEIQKENSLKKNLAHKGQTLEILIDEERTSRSTDKFQGRTDGNKLTIFPAGNYRQGELVNVRILEASPHALRGEVVDN